MRRTALNIVLLASLAAALLVGIGTPTADAAVRRCGKPVLSGMQYGQTELDARRAAIGSWRAKAARLGRAFTSWRLAARKRYTCGRLKSGPRAGAYVCVAFAAPCRIIQRPPPFGRKLPPSPRAPGSPEKPKVIQPGEAQRAI